MHLEQRLGAPSWPQPSQIGIADSETPDKQLGEFFHVAISDHAVAVPCICISSINMGWRALVLGALCAGCCAAENYEVTTFAGQKGGLGSADGAAADAIFSPPFHCCGTFRK